MIYVNSPYQGISDGETQLARFEAPPGDHLRVGIINLMPDKRTNEQAWLRMLSGVEADVLVTFLYLTGQPFKSSTNFAYVSEHYVEATETIVGECDFLTVTGVPVGHLDDPFGEFLHWEALCDLFDCAKARGTPILGSCWGGNALLKHRHGLSTKSFDKKRLGIFEQVLLCSPDDFPFCDQLPAAMAVTRRLNLSNEDAAASEDIAVVWGSDSTGIFLAIDRKTRDIFILNHVEYDYSQLVSEYERDVRNGIEFLEGDVPIMHPSVPELTEKWQAAGRSVIELWVKFIQNRTPPYEA